MKTMSGQMIMVGLRGTSPEDAKSFFDSHHELTVGGIILYDQNVTTDPPSSHNIKSPEQVIELNQSLQSNSSTPLLIGVDQEGGQVNRLKKEYGFPHSKSWADLGRLNDEAQTDSHSKGIASSLSSYGFNLNFAPVVDLSLNRENVIVQKGRCFSDDPDTVATHAKLFINAHLNQNVIPVCKHFPGQGSARGDTHEGLVDVSETWSENELKPYQKLIDRGCVPAIMTSHLFHKGLDPDFPATLSSKIINELLREQLGFDGVIISDDPQMGAIAKHYDLKTVIQLMIHAGVDMFCFGNNLIYDPDIVQKVHTIIGELLDEGSITAEQIQRSYDRVMCLKIRIGLV